MTNENVLKLLYEMNVDSSDLKTVEAYKSLIEGIKDNIRDSANKAAGKNTLAKNAKAIIKNAVKSTCRKALHGAWTAKNGKQYVCDSYRILEINNPIELPELPDEVKKSDYFKAYEIIEEAQSQSTHEIKIPTIQELKAEIKIMKSQIPKTTGSKKKPGVILTLIDKGLSLNTQYLLELSEALGGIETIYVSERSPNTNPVYMMNETGLGLLCPIRNAKEMSKGYWLG